MNHNLLTITDGRRNDPNDPTFGQGPYLVNIYASATDPSDPNFDHIIRQIWGGDIIDLVYVPILPCNANGDAVMKTIIRDRVGDVKEYFFDAMNRAVRRREYTGRADPTQPTTELSNRPTGPLRPTDPEYFETIFAWNQDSLQTNVIYPNGNLTENVYEGDMDTNAPPRSRGNLRSTQMLPGTYSPAGDQAVIQESFEYDSDYGSSCCGFNFVTRHVDARGNETRYTYDSHGNRTHAQYRLPTIVEDWEYNQFGQTVAHVLPDDGTGYRRRDQRTFYGSGPQLGYLQSEAEDVNGFALTATYGYDAVGNVVSAIDPRGHDSQYVVNSLNQVVRLISREVTDGSGIRYQRDVYYDANNNVTRVDVLNVDENGVTQPNAYFTSTYDYEILNQLTQMTEEVDTNHTVATQFVFDANRNRIMELMGEAVNGHQPANVVQTLYDERDRPFRITKGLGDPGQSTTQLDYDGNGNLVRTMEGLEDAPRTTLLVYDAYNRLVLTTDALGNALTHSYDANGNAIDTLAEGELVDQPGASNNVRLGEITYDYDAMDRQMMVTSQFFDAASQMPIAGGQSVTEIAYTPMSRVSRMVDANGHVTQFSYDTADRRAAVTDAKGNLLQFGYDQNGNILTRTQVEKSDAGNPVQTFVTTMTYDNLDRLVRTIDNAGNINDFGYDSRDNLTVNLDAARATPIGPGNKSQHVYDGLNRLIQTTRFLTADGTGSGAPVGTIVARQTWDDSSRLTSQTDGNGQTTSQTYDALNRVTAVRMADGTAQTYAFDVHNNPVMVNDANGTAIKMTYDLLNRLIRKDLTNGPTVASDTTFETFQYDGLSRLVRAENDASMVALAYDSLGNITSDTLNGKTTTMTYDAQGNPVLAVYPGGRVVGASYDELERKKMISDLSGSASNLIGDYSYIGPVRVEQRQLANGTDSAFTYDAAKRIVRTTPAGRRRPAFR